MGFVKGLAVNAGRRLAHVACYANGMVLAFDQHGEQMPDYQGAKDEVWEKIQRDKTAATHFWGDHNPLQWDPGAGRG